jgi:hypothetical protein
MDAILPVQTDQYPQWHWNDGITDLQNEGFAIVVAFCVLSHSLLL